MVQFTNILNTKKWESLYKNNNAHNSVKVFNDVFVEFKKTVSHRNL